MRTHRTAGLASLALTAALTGAVGLAGPPATAAPLADPDIPVADVQAHLAQLQSIATANGGNRYTARAGHTASLNYVRGKLDAAGYTTSVQSVSTSAGTSQNLVAELRGATDPTSVVMFGGHLDSVSNGPGINDNGSGSAGLLESALALAASGQAPRNTVRFGFWTAEELGLVGSKAYMASLSTTEKNRIRLYFNVDMIGSPNPGYFVYDDNAAGNAVRDEITAYYDAKGIPWEYIDVQGRSDHAAFRSYGIPTAGIFSGAEGTKSSAQAAKWGGTAGQAFDRCYHSSCDTSSNINATALDRGADLSGAIVFRHAAKDYGTTTPPQTGTNLLRNAGFESGAVDWTGTTGAITSSASKPARTGSWKAWLGGNGRTSTETLQQTVAVPAAAAAPTLSFWLRTDTAERGSTAYDTLRVQVVSGSTTTTLGTVSNTAAASGSGYVQKSFSLASYKGTSVAVKLVATEDASLQTSFVVDDVVVSAG